LIKLYNIQNKKIGYGLAPLYIIAGQSNCGRSRWSEASAGQISTYGGAKTGIKIYNYKYNTTDFTTLVPGTNTMLENYLALDEIGPEVSLSKSLLDNGITEAYIIKVGIGNTDLYNTWSPGGSSEVIFNDRMNRAFNWLYSNNIKFALKGFIWMQGENDATNQTWANAYLYKIENFFQDFSFYLQNKINRYSFPNYKSYKKVIGRINGINDASEIYRGTVRQAQADYCSNTSNNAVLIDTDSYAFKDYVHYSVTGQIQFGIDIYNQIKNL
jgi:hypothetical protein